MSYELSEERVISAHKPPTLRSIGLAVAAAAPDPPDGFVDISDVSRMTGLFGLHC